MLGVLQVVKLAVKVRFIVTHYVADWIYFICNVKMDCLLWIIVQMETLTKEVVSTQVRSGTCILSFVKTKK